MKFLKEIIHIEGCIAAKRKDGKAHQAAKPALFLYKGEQWNAARISYDLNCRSIPRTPEDVSENCLVLHTCNRRWCINPDHLYLGNTRQNTLDWHKDNPHLRQILSEAAKGNTHRRGKKHSYEARYKQRQAKLGKVTSEETKRKMSESLRRSWQKRKEETASC